MVKYKYYRNIVLFEDIFNRDHFNYDVCSTSTFYTQYGKALKGNAPICPGPLMLYKRRAREHKAKTHKASNIDLIIPQGMQPMLNCVISKENPYGQD